MKCNDVGGEAELLQLCFYAVALGLQTIDVSDQRFAVCTIGDGEVDGALKLPSDFGIYAAKLQCLVAVAFF